MNKEQYLKIIKRIKSNGKPLALTLLVLFFIGAILLLIRNIRSSDPIEVEVENAAEQKENAKAEPDMEQLIFRIQNCSRLYTTEYQVHKIITHEDQKELSLLGVKMELPFTDRRIAVPIDATLKAYVDLGGFSEQNITTNGEYLVVTLPDPHIEITSSIVDHDNTKSHVSIVRENYTAKEQEALHRQGLNSIARNILNTDILEHARHSAARTLIPILTRMGYKEENIRINFSKDTYDVADLSRLIDGNVIKIQPKK